MKYLEYRNGDKMPAVGLGTWKAKGEEVRKAVYDAIKIGYRHIDTAAIYENEKYVGQGIRKALKEGIVERDDLWVTSKLWNNAHEKDQVIPAIEKTLHDLELDYLDLYLIHWPVAFDSDSVWPEEDRGFLSLEQVPLDETWRMMEEIKAKKLSKHIGVSNFNRPKIEELIEKGTEKPEMNQIELHPYLPQTDLVNWCQEQEVHVTAYSPLGSTDRSEKMKSKDEPTLMDNEVILDIAEKHDVHPAQVLIAWSVNRRTAVIPKSTDPDHQKANLAAADISLDKDDMEKIQNIGKKFRYIDGSAFVTEGNPYTLEGLWEK